MPRAIRYSHHGEGEYAMAERVIRQLLAKAGHAPAGGMANESATGAEAAAALNDIGSPSDLHRLLSSGEVRLAGGPVASFELARPAR